MPAFANPFLAEGIIPGQQTYNRQRNIYDATLQLLPGKIISPILEFTRNTYSGPGTTTYHLGGNEFQLNDQVNSVDDLYRLGFNFQYGPVQGGVTQGWRYYRWNQTNTLVPGAGDGNVTTPVLGQDVTADAIASVQENKINTPVTNAWVTGSLFGRLKLIGSYMKADGSNETRYVEGDAGNFVSFEISRFFAGLGETVNSRARTDYWQGSARAEFDVTSNVQVAGGWSENSRTLTGQALIASLYLNTVTFAGVPAGELLQLIDARTFVERQDTVFDAGGDGADARTFLGQRGLVPAPAGRPRDPRCLRDHRAGRPGRRVRTHGQHLRRRFHVRGVRRDPDGRLPSRRRQPADLPDRLHQPGPLQVPGTLEFQGLPEGRSGLFRDPRRRRHRRDRLQGERARVRGRRGGLAPQEHADAAGLGRESSRPTARSSSGFPRTSRSSRPNRKNSATPGRAACISSGKTSRWMPPTSG